MADKYFQTPFAENGDKTVVPDAPQVDGSVSYDTGYGYDYERDPNPLVDPLTKDIERDKMNQLFNDVTGTLRQIQRSGGAPKWYAARATDGGYPKGAAVEYTDGKLYSSTADGNTTEPTTPGALWTLQSTLDPTLQTIANLTPGANQYIYFTAPDVAAVADITSFARTFLTQANTTQALVNSLGFNTWSTQLVTIYNSPGLARTHLGITPLGSSIVTAATVTDFRIAVGITVFGGNLIGQPNAAAARVNVLGATTVGDALFTTANAAAARATLEIVPATNAAAGLMRVATLTEVQTGSGDIAVPPQHLRNGISRFGDQNAGGMNYPSWWASPPHQVRWGRVTVPAGGNLLVTGLHSNLCLNVSGVTGYTSSTDQYELKVNLEGTGFRAYNTNETPLVFNYHTEGY